MEKMVGFCGIVCSECPAFLATQRNDDSERSKVADMWSKHYHADIRPEHINCDGCVSKSQRIFSHPRVCEVRKCGQEKGLENCAYCDEYACEKLGEFFEMVPDAKTTLDEIRKNL